MPIKRSSIIVFFFTLIALVGGSYTYRYFSSKGEKISENNHKRQEKQVEKKEQNDTSVHLYFADKKNAYLIAEQRVLFHTEDPYDLARFIMKGIISGPREGLERTIPKNTSLLAFYLTSDGTAYVDLSESIRVEHCGGVQSEIMTIYSIVNSLILNISQVKSVKLLIGGREAKTLAGHIDLRFPFKANMLLIR